MKTVTSGQYLLLIIAIGLILLVWKKNSVNGEKLPAESGKKQMECNEYFFFRNASMV